MGDGLSEEQLQAYQRDGFVVQRSVFSAAECDAFIEHMMDLQAGRKSIEGFDAKKHQEWGRTHNQHVYDPMALDLMIHERLRQPLESCFEDSVDAIQTMYFWKGSEQRRHQDQYYLPGCMSAWIALMDVSPRNGTIHVQIGSHHQRLWTKADFIDEQGEALPTFGPHYNDRVDQQFSENGLPEEPVCANAGDVVFFDGRLIHRGGPIAEPGSFRHVLACHYIPYHFEGWPYEDWERISFDRERRLTKFKDSA